jgi:exodeoxyribonuclease-3
MKILSYNVNGIRAATKKGLAAFLAENSAEIVCLQEIKAEEKDLDFSPFAELGYQSWWFPAEKKGYSGVAIFSKKKPNSVEYGCGHNLFDSEGRHLLLDFGGFAVQSLYAPSGTTGDQRQKIKFEWMDFFMDYQQKIRSRFPSILFCGDFNICHRPIDIHNPKSNQKTSGFLPEERAWMEELLTNGSLTDSFRRFHPETPHQYSWWSLRAGSRGKNLGWRIDYMLASEQLCPELQAARLLPDALHSDHCPMELTLA